MIVEVPLPSGEKLTIKVPKKKTESAQTDGVFNYGKRLLELGLLFKDMLDANKIPERSRLISLLKLCMMLLKAHRHLSKYAYEILRLLVHQLCILSEKAACEEFYSLFVNTKGQKDSHIPADLRMEYLVKEVKNHIKHMCSNKTEKNINTKTSAISGIKNIAENYDLASNVVVRSTRHGEMSSRGDELALLDTLRNVRPFCRTPGRYHRSFQNISNSGLDNIDIQEYYKWITRKKTQFATEHGN